MITSRLGYHCKAAGGMPLVRNLQPRLESAVWPDQPLLLLIPTRQRQTADFKVRACCVVAEGTLHLACPLQPVSGVGAPIPGTVPPPFLPPGSQPLGGSGAPAAGTAAASPSESLIVDGPIALLLESNYGILNTFRCVAKCTC